MTEWIYLYLFFSEFVSRAHVTMTKRRSRYGHFIYDWFVQRLHTGVVCRGSGLESSEVVGVRAGSARYVLFPSSGTLYYLRHMMTHY